MDQAAVMPGAVEFTAAASQRMALAVSLMALLAASLLQALRLPLAVVGWGAAIILPLDPLRLVAAALAANGMLGLLRPDTGRIPDLLLATIAGSLAGLAAAEATASLDVLDEGARDALSGSVAGPLATAAGLCAAGLAGLAFTGRDRWRSVVAFSLVGAVLVLPLAGESSDPGASANFRSAVPEAVTPTLAYIGGALILAVGLGLAASERSGQAARRKRRKWS
ncbi:hypothetical protein [Rhodosalinus sediminis]|uniref:hypothetical protein n=1 Tax=Rhodosalinus sediminis TaxID=1940533 RepID=UPI002353EABB|nr:hypothetical protein [Rhodosalinus sediminis]